MARNSDRDKDGAEIVGITKATLDRIYKGQLSGDVSALYLLLNHTATWQKTNQPWATTEYCAKKLGWGRDKTRRAKKVLVSYGLVEDVRHVDKKTGRTEKWFLRLPKKLKQSTILKTSWVASPVHPTGNHPPDLPQDAESAACAFKTDNKDAYRNGRKEEKEENLGSPPLGLAAPDPASSFPAKEEKMDRDAGEGVRAGSKKKAPGKGRSPGKESSPEEEGIDPNDLANPKWSGPGIDRLRELENKRLRGIQRRKERDIVEL